MNITRFQALFEGINSAARKVYNVCPISETWDIAQIIRELDRTTGRMDYRVVHGCLCTLVDIGLVLEPSRGEYKRTQVRERAPAPVTTPTPKEEPVMQVETKPVAPVTKQSPLDILAELATRSKQLTADIEHAALVIQEHLDSNEKDMERFRQLQALLKGI